MDRSGAIAGSRRFEDVEVPPFTSSAATAIAQYYDDAGAFSGDESEVPRPGYGYPTFADDRHCLVVAIFALRILSIISVYLMIAVNRFEGFDLCYVGFLSSHCFPCNG